MRGLPGAGPRPNTGRESGKEGGPRLTLRAHGFAEGQHRPRPSGSHRLNGVDMSLGAPSSWGGTGFSLEGPSSLLRNTQVLSSGAPIPKERNPDSKLRDHPV